MIGTAADFCLHAFQSQLITRTAGNEHSSPRRTNAQFFVPKMRLADGNATISSICNSSFAGKSCNQGRLFRVDHHHEQAVVGGYVYKVHVSKTHLFVFLLLQVENAALRRTPFWSYLSPRCSLLERGHCRC